MISQQLKANGKKYLEQPVFLLNGLFLVLIGFFAYKFMKMLRGDVGNGSWFSDAFVNNTGVAGNSPDQQNTDNGIKKLVDQIKTNLSGDNLITYPEIVNRLANLTALDLKRACNYWNMTYKASTGYNFYSFIYGEWSSADTWAFDGVYQPALDAFENANLKNY